MVVMLYMYVSPDSGTNSQGFDLWTGPWVFVPGEGIRFLNEVL